MSERCSATTKRGPCQGLAMRGTDPPLCGPHAIKRGGVAPRGNQNARKTGFYSAVIDADELADLVVLGDDTTLSDEIAAVRVAMRRVLEALGREGGDRPLGERAAEQVFEGARTVARLLRDRQAISGEAADGFADAIGAALDHLNSIWGTDL